MPNFLMCEMNLEILGIFLLRLDTKSKFDAHLN